MASQRKPRVLFLHNISQGNAGTVEHHLSVLRQCPGLETCTLGTEEFSSPAALSGFDGICVHFSVAASLDSHLSPEQRRWIRESEALKLVFIQDDYRWIYRTVATLKYLKAHVVFTLSGEKIIDDVLPPQFLPSARRRETTLTGYVDLDLVKKEVKPYANRPIDVGYRARKVPFWIGRHALQKWQIAERFVESCAGKDLVIDVSIREEDRIYGEDWIDFVGNCKATLGTESGASLCDFTGETQSKVDAYLEKHPDADFDEVEENCFPGEDCIHMMNVISPRTFEAAALRTLMILYPGEYNGILEPGRHYVCLEPDHSNIEEVVEVLQDEEKASAIIQTAYEEIAQNSDYSPLGLQRQFEKVVREEWEAEGDATVTSPENSTGPAAGIRFDQIDRPAKPKRAIEDLSLVPRLLVMTKRKLQKIGRDVALPLEAFQVGQRLMGAPSLKQLSVACGDDWSRRFREQVSTWSVFGKLDDDAFSFSISPDPVTTVRAFFGHDSDETDQSLFEFVEENLDEISSEDNALEVDDKYQTTPAGYQVGRHDLSGLIQAIGEDVDAARALARLVVRRLRNRVLEEALSGERNSFQDKLARRAFSFATKSL